MIAQTASASVQLRFTDLTGSDWLRRDSTGDAISELRAAMRDSSERLQAQLAAAEGKLREEILASGAQIRESFEKGLGEQQVETEKSIEKAGIAAEERSTGLQEQLDACEAMFASRLEEMKGETALQLDTIRSYVGDSAKAAGILSNN